MPCMVSEMRPVGKINWPQNPKRYGLRSPGQSKNKPDQKIFKFQSWKRVWFMVYGPRKIDNGWGLRGYMNT